MKLHFHFKRSLAGIFPEERKERTEQLPIKKAKVPDMLIFPLNMHIGKPAKAVVSVGDYVKIGSLLAEADGGISANVLSSVSGKVMAISSRQTVKGPHQAIVIQNDFKDDKDEAFFKQQKLESSADKLSMIRRAGIVGMGGATFPTDVKASAQTHKPIDTIIINGAECEPYSTSDHRMMIEHAETIVKGARHLQKLLAAKRVYIALEDDTPDCETALLLAINDFPDFEIKVLQTMYPQGAEKVLIKKLTGREVPSAGLPADVRTFVTNVSTAHAVYEAIEEQKPLFERVTTVTGEAIRQPQNLRVRIGTPINCLIEECGGFSSPPAKLLHGGPMMGIAIDSADIPITKGSSVITFLLAEEVTDQERTDCIRCSECLNVCPVNLQPILISNAYERGDINEAERLGAMDCIECGNCSFICPSKIPLLENIRSAKTAIKAKNAG